MKTFIVTIDSGSHVEVHADSISIAHGVLQFTRDNNLVAAFAHWSAWSEKGVVTACTFPSKLPAETEFQRRTSLIPGGIDPGATGDPDTSTDSDTGAPADSDTPMP